MRLLPLLALCAACSNNNDAAISDGSTTSDGALADGKGADAPKSIDAPPMEMCSSGGWCQVPMSPSYAYGLSVAPPNGQPWIVGFGIDTKTSNGWASWDPSWPDLADPFVFHTELQTVYALAPTDVWVAGDQGYVSHYASGAWQDYRPAAPSVRGIWGATSNDVWLLYDSGLRYHWTGSALTSMPTAQMRYSGAWGTAANDVWGFGETASGGSPAFDHYDGTTWTRTTLTGSGRVIALWGASASDLYAVVYPYTSTNRLMHFDGTAWTQVAPAGVNPLDVWGRAANDLWVVGYQGAIAHWDGSAWSASASGTTKTLSEIDGTATVVYAAGDGVMLRKP